MSTSPSAPLAGRVALVTGASRGIGAAAAVALAERGASIAIAHEPQAERATEASAVAARIRSAGGRAVTLAADLADPTQIEQLVEDAAGAWGDLDVVIANAAATGSRAWDEISLDEWDLVQNVNVRGTYLLARVAVPHLRRSSGASIIALTSVMAETGQPGALHYTTSKAAIIGLVRGLARELGGEGIRVNAVMPGAIQTEDELDRFPDQQQVATSILPLQSLQRRGTAHDLAGAFAFLAGDDSAFVTGQILTVDGGWVFR